jgi:hypothetical protein
MGGRWEDGGDCGVGEGAWAMKRKMIDVIDYRCAFRPWAERQKPLKNVPLGP